MISEIDYMIIENVYPEIDEGRSFVKRSVGDIYCVEADILFHGHDILKASLLYKSEDETEWNETEMELIENDRWRGSFPLNENKFYEYTIAAWRDPFVTWVQDTFKKYIDGQNIKSELSEGKTYIENAAKKAKGEDKEELTKILKVFEKGPSSDKKVTPKKNGNSDNEPLLENIIFGEEIVYLMNGYSEKINYKKYDKILKVFVNRKEAEFSSWYEMWPRSQGTVEGKSATFKDMEKRLKEINDMGFSVIYLPPIHPIGTTNRKGSNNSTESSADDPGCPFAIGNKNGGHMAIEPTLGTLNDFVSFEKKCKSYGMEIALDLAIQTSPDHPWVKEHPQWFSKRPDGTIKYSENPPKKYEDIYPVNFDTEDKEGLFKEILKIVKFWIGQGVKIYRVDNPHTKPILFWKWLISEVHKTDPDVIFLAEAFTRPKIMKALAKAGFTQSYTYFTWRNFKYEIMDYFYELVNTEVGEYMWGNLFTNTPDILPQVLQNAPAASFKVRAALAATLSSIWGVYNGFELCEGTPIPGKEEYLNSEKYQFKVWDWDRPGNIKYFVKLLNNIRKKFSALQKYKNLAFYRADNDAILFYAKYTENYHSVILVVVNLDPYNLQESFVYLPIRDFGLKEDETFQVRDLLSEERFYWQGEKNFVVLDPEKEPVHIFELVRLSHNEQEFDYFY